MADKAKEPNDANQPTAAEQQLEKLRRENEELKAINAELSKSGIELPPDVEKQIQEKVDAGLTLEQATMVVKHQLANDAALKKNRKN